MDDFGGISDGPIVNILIVVKIKGRASLTWLLFNDVILRRTIELDLRIHQTLLRCYGKVAFVKVRLNSKSLDVDVAYLSSDLDSPTPRELCIS